MLTQFGIDRFDRKRVNFRLNLFNRTDAAERVPVAGHRVGAGAGVNIPHVEVTRASGTTSEYQLGGATLQVQAGLDYKITDNWSVFTEYKGNYSMISADIDSGSTLKTDIWTNAVNFGVSYHF